MLEQDIATRTCRRCKLDKPLDQFSRTMKYLCRKCNSEQGVLARQERRDRARLQAEPDWSRILNWPAPGRTD